MEDNHDQFLAREARQDAWLTRRPECDHCGHHIQYDHYYYINDTVICPDCMENHFRQEID